METLRQYIPTNERERRISGREATKRPPRGDGNRWCPSESLRPATETASLYYSFSRGSALLLPILSVTHTRAYAHTHALPPIPKFAKPLCNSSRARLRRWESAAPERFPSHFIRWVCALSLCLTCNSHVRCGLPLDLIAIVSNCEPNFPFRVSCAEIRGVTAVLIGTPVLVGTTALVGTPFQGSGHCFEIVVVVGYLVYPFFLSRAPAEILSQWIQFEEIQLFFAASNLSP